MRWLLSLCCWLLVSVATAAEVGIVGPTAVPAPGIPCTLHLEGELPAGTIVGWTVTPRNDELRQIDPAPDGISAKLTTVAGLWNVCAAIHEPDRPIYFRFYKVHVPGVPYVPSPGPTPAPPSPPPPGPSPPTPPAPGPAPAPEVPNRFGLRVKTAETARGVNSPNRPAEIRCLADGLRDIGQGIERGTLTGPQAIVNAIGQTLDRCTSTAWDNSREGLSAFIEALLRSGQLATNDDWKQAVREAEAGLRDVQP